MNRRKFCLSSVAAAISGAAAGAAGLAADQAPRVSPADSTPGVRFYKFIYDRRYAASRAFGAAAEHTRPTSGTLAIGGDITEFWSRELRPQWTAGGGVIAGMTTPRTLFCLEQLAKDHWMRVVIRIEHAISDGPEMAHRLTASGPMISRLRSALMAEDWPRKIPAVLTTCRAEGARRLTRVIGPACGRGSGATDGLLVSFVIT